MAEVKKAHKAEIATITAKHESDLAALNSKYETNLRDEKTLKRKADEVELERAIGKNQELITTNKSLTAQNHTLTSEKAKLDEELAKERATVKSLTDEKATMNTTVTETLDALKKIQINYARAEKLVGQHTLVVAGKDEEIAELEEKLRIANAPAPPPIPHANGALATVPDFGLANYTAPDPNIDSAFAQGVSTLAALAVSAQLDASADLTGPEYDDAAKEFGDMEVESLGLPQL